MTCTTVVHLMGESEWKLNGSKTEFLIVSILRDIAELILITIVMSHSLLHPCLVFR